jgi:hypothetical protein
MQKKVSFIPACYLFATQLTPTSLVCECNVYFFMAVVRHNEIMISHSQLLTLSTHTVAQSFMEFILIRRKSTCYLSG